MSNSDKINADPEGERASDLDEQDVVQKKFKSSQKSLENNQNSDQESIPTIVRILECGINHWYAEKDNCLLSFDFENEDQGLTPV